MKNSPAALSVSIPATLLLLASLPAQTSFTSANYAAGAASPIAVATADLDGDGDVDAAHAHAVADVVQANLNLGGGTSWSAGLLFSYAAGSRPVELVLDDYDSNGRVDVAVVLQGTSQVSIHRGTGAWPGFLLPQLVAVGGGALEAVSFDVDLDSDLDLAVLCQTPPSVHILRNTAGVFVNAGSVPLTVTPHAITAANFNSVGAEDLVVTGSFGTAFAEVLLNQSTTSTVAFTPGQTFGVDFRPFGVCAGDFNGDGYADIATSNAAFSTTTVLLAIPASITATTVGYSGTTYPLAPGVISGPATEIECADFDCDSDGDLAVVCNATNDVVFLWNNGAGSFAAPPPVPFPAPGTPNDLALADFDGDGWIDAITSDSSAGQISVLINNLGFGCCRHEFIGGIIDNFSNAQPNGPEDACPGPQLLAYYGGPRRDFDGPVQCSRVFMHTFRLPRNIKSAVLRMAVRADCTSPGDHFGLGFNTPGSFVFNSTLGTLTSSPWTAGSTGGFGFDLSALPGGIDLLPKMAADGRLDVWIRSNTAVDFIYLVVETCARATVELNLSATPYVTPGTWTWSVSGAPPSFFGALLLDTAVGPGPATPYGQFCLPNPTLFQIFPTDALGNGSTSLTVPIPLVLPCFNLSAQAVAWNAGLTIVRFSNTLTQQIFD